VRAEGGDMSRHTARCTTLRLRTRSLLPQLRAVVGCEVDIEHIPRHRSDHLAVVPRFRWVFPMFSIPTPRLTMQTKHIVYLLGAASAWNQLDG
jgi:hypothetical protein